MQVSRGLLFGEKHESLQEDCCLEKNMNHYSPVEFRQVPIN